MYIIRIGMPYYLLIIDALAKGIPSQQVINVGTNIELVNEKVKYAPVFGAYYLVITEFQKGQTYWRIVKELASKNYIKLVITVRTKEQFSNLITKAEDGKIDFKIYDSYKASKRDRNMYIVKTLRSYNPNVKLSKSALNAIRERLYGYSFEVNGYLQQLAYTNLTVATVQKIIPKKSILTTASFGWLLYSGEISVAEADSFLLRYKYYPYAISESLKRYTAKLLTVLPFYIKGLFTEYNYEKFCAENKKLIQSQYVAKTYLDIFKSLSAERLYLIDGLLNSIGDNRINDIFILYKVIRLIRGDCNG